MACAGGRSRAVSAVRWDARSESFCDAPARLGEREISVLSTAEMRILVAAAESDRLGSLYILAAHTGMREGELLGLRWRDIDLAASSLTVAHTLTHDRQHRLVLDTPKTARSRRTLPLTSGAVDALVRQQEVDDLRRSEDAGWNPEGFVFTTTTGTPINPSNLLRRHFYPFGEGRCAEGAVPRPATQLRHRAAR